MSSAYPARFLDRATPPHIVTLICATGVSTLSINIFLPALPAMTEHFGTPYRVMQLSVASYLAASAVLQIFIGPISDKFGRRPVVLSCVFLFVLASFGCLLAPSIELFLIARILQAFMVGGLVLSRAAVRDVLPQNQAASMLGYVTMGMAVVPMIGPALGGVLTALFGWKACFWALALSGIGTLILLYKDMGETRQPSDTSLLQQFAQYPELFRSQRFWGYCAAAALSSGAFFIYLGGAPFVGSEVFKLDSTTLGFYFGAPALGYVVGNFITGRYAARFGINIMILVGTIGTSTGLTCGLILFELGHETPLVFFGFMTSIGLGNGLVIPNATSGMLSVRPRLAGTASGLGGAIMIGGGAGLSAYAGTLLSPGSGAEPLLVLMVLTSTLSILAILLVMRRERALGT